MTDLLWEKIEDEFEHNSAASINVLMVRRAPTNMHLIVSEYVDGYQSGFFIHEDEFSDMFGSGIARALKTKLDKQDSALIHVALEVA